MLAYRLWRRCFAYCVQRDVRVLLEKKTMFAHCLCRRITCLSIACEQEVCIQLAKKMFWVLFVKKTFLHCLGRRTCLHIVCEEDDIDRESFHTCLAVCLSSITCPYMSFCLYVHHNTGSVMLSLLATTDSGVFQKSCFWNLSDECKGKGQSRALVVIQQVLLKMVGAHLPWKVSDCCLWQICCIFHCNRK